ncbi:ABC transporter permease subunit [Terrilactibacillus laevilacticus]|uniref:ABC transporter permease subunit n=1 Tax=Terrilactibacillus laevilacticus TaxID=1380157 RepID=A0ABW5PQP1_9BACI|nr:ABC transporter permease subunit [Terrilactibacillus laevilacticus]
MQLLRLIQNENMKLYKRKMLWIMLALIVASVILTLVITLKTSDSHPDNWKQTTEQEIKENQKIMNQKGIPKAAKDQIAGQMKVDQYRLDHNIAPLFDDTALGFVDSAIGSSGLITLFIIIIAASIVSQEYAWGTMKLVLMRPVQRWKVLLAKYLSVLFNALLLLVFLGILAFIVGAIVFGFKDTSFQYVYERNGIVHQTSIFTHFFLFGLSHYIGMIMIAAFAFMLSTLFKNNALAIALSIFIEFAGSIIGSILAMFGKSYVKYLFFVNTDLMQYIEGSPSIKGMTLGFSITVLLVYFIIFMGISFFTFEKRDVAN